MANIILLGSYAPSLINFRGSLLYSLVKEGHRVTACAPGVTDDIEYSLNEMGVSCRNVFIRRTGTNPFSDVYTILALKRLFVQEKTDVLLSYTIKPVIYGSLAAGLAHVPSIYSMITGLGYAFTSGSFKQNIVSNVAQLLYRSAIKKNKQVFFQNHDDRALFVKLGLVKSKTQTVIINGSGVDLECYQVTPLPEKISFLLIARLINKKGIYEYVEAARIVHKRFPEIDFSLVGWIDSSPLAINKNDLRKWQQDDIIDYKGKLEDVRSAISNSAVYVLPSYREGTPRTVLEAMAMGRPIITTDVPGCRETVINKKNGYLVPPKDPIALAKAMERFILDPKLIYQMGRESRKIAVEKYDVQKVNKVIIDTMNLTNESQAWMKNNK